jgi:hypothetical protein
LRGAFRRPYEICGIRGSLERGTFAQSAERAETFATASVGDLRSFACPPLGESARARVLG